MKTKGIAYLLWCTCFFGICGVQRFYTGRVISGMLWLLTFGLLGIGQLVDLFLIPGMVESANRGMRRRLLEEDASTPMYVPAVAE